MAGTGIDIENQEVAEHAPFNINTWIEIDGSEWDGDVYPINKSSIAVKLYGHSHSSISDPTRRREIELRQGFVSGLVAPAQLPWGCLGGGCPDEEEEWNYGMIEADVQPWSDYFEGDEGDARIETMLYNYDILDDPRRFGKLFYFRIGGMELEPGLWHFTVEVDPDSYITELYEDNNISELYIRITKMEVPPMTPISVHLPDSDFENDSGSIDAGGLRIGDYFRCIWAGTSMWVCINDFDREILMIDGYASKSSPLGGDDYDFDSPEATNRVVRVANLIRGYLEHEQYDLVGIITAHWHGDHVGDLGVFKQALRSGITHLLSGSNRSTEHLRHTNLQDYEWRQIPVIGSWTDVHEGHCSSHYDCKSVFTHWIEFKDINGDPLSNQRINDQHRLGDRFAIEADLIATGVVDGTPAGTRITCPSCTEGSFKLGHFEIQPYMWDHSNPPAFRTGRWRTVAYRIWHDTAPEARKVFITTSMGEWKNEASCDDAVAVLAEYEIEFIYTDYLIYAWRNNIYWPPYGDAERAADCASRTIRFTERGLRPNAIILANHHDANGGCDSDTGAGEANCPVGDDRASEMYETMKDQGAIQRGSITIPDGDTRTTRTCWHWIGSNRCVELLEFQIRLGMSPLADLWH
jgi:hypothetical protein